MTSNNISNNSMNADESMDIFEHLDKEELKQLVTEHLESGEYETAVFWAEKIVALSFSKNVMDNLPDLAYFMEVLTAARKWQMIITFINKHDIFLTHLNRWEGVPFQVPESAVYLTSKHMQIEDSEVQRILDDLLVQRKYEARFMIVLANTYIMVQNRMAAASCLKNCLFMNPYSSEALHMALNSRLMTPEQLKEIIASTDSTNKSGIQVMKSLLEIYNINESYGENSNLITKSIAKDLSVQSAEAFRLYYKGDMNAALDITSEIIDEYGYYEKCFLIHVACLVFLKKSSELYVLGHKMVKLLPDMEVTWYTVGCYYYATEQYSIAKKFLSKATTMNPGFGEGWLTYGHALYYAEEHEQAMNCYLRASRILEGHYEPLMYIGVEYSFGNNFKFATNFLNDAIAIAGVNPVIIHEQANVFYMKHEYSIAEEMYYDVLRIITNTKNKKMSVEAMCQFPVNAFWEPVFNNFGHVLRKLEKYQDAIFVHRKSLLMNNLHGEAWCCIGLCYASMNKLSEASEAFNKALAIRPNDENATLGLTKIYDFMSTIPITALDALNMDKNLEDLLKEHNEKFKSVQKEKFDTPSRMDEDISI